MPWICPRCQTVHSDLKLSCGCPPPTGTAGTTYPTTNLPCPCTQMVGRTVPTWCNIHQRYA